MTRPKLRRCAHKTCANPPATYTITGPSSTHSVELCALHATPLMEAAALGRVVGTPRGRSEAEVMDGLWEE